MTTYEPGTVAMVTNGDEQLLAFRVSWPTEDWVSVDDGSLHAVTDVRPLIVLDLSPFEVERTVGALRDSRAFVAWQVADQIKAQTKPPKPEVYEHLVTYETRPDDRILTAACGKVWRPKDRDEVTVVGACPDCVRIAEEGWSA